MDGEEVVVTGGSGHDALSRCDGTFDGVTLVEVDFGGMALDGVSFRSATLRRCRFGGRERPATLVGASFHDARLLECDLRYLHVTRTSFERAHFRWCDLYRAVFETDCVFDGSRLRDCSVFRADLSGTNLRRGNLVGSGRQDRILQEDPARFEEYHRRLATPVSDSELDLLRRNLDREAASVFQNLCGLWSSQGAYSDESWAYERRKRAERRALGSQLSRQLRGRPVDIRASVRPMGALSALWMADLTCGFGERLGRAVLALVTLAGVTAAVLVATGAVTRTDGSPASLSEVGLVAVGNLVANTPDRLVVSPGPVEWLLILETLLGVTLAGLIGFIVANRVRHS